MIFKKISTFFVGVGMFFYFVGLLFFVKTILPLKNKFNGGAL